MTPFVPAGIESPALAVVAYIVDSAWEAVAIVALAALVIRLFKRANATTRYAVWYIALLAVIVLPAVTVAAMLLAPHALAQGPRIALPHAVTLIAAALWGVGALAGLLRIAVGYAALAKLQRDALPLPPGYREAMPLWEESIGRGRETRLCVSSNVAVPVAVGLFDGMILMPDHLLESFDRADVDRFSLHEMAHLQRRDDWTCALERIACAVLFFNPAVRWIARQLDLEREVACDDWVVAQTREVRPYAVGLTKMAEATKWPHRAVPTPAIFASRKSISIRIERLLNKHRDVRPTLTGGPAVACGAAILAASAVLLSVAPVIGSVNTAAAPLEVGKAQPGPAMRRKQPVKPPALAHAKWPARVAVDSGLAGRTRHPLETVNAQVSANTQVSAANAQVAASNARVAAARRDVTASTARIAAANAHLKRQLKTSSAVLATSNGFVVTSNGQVARSNADVAAANALVAAANGRLKTTTLTIDTAHHHAMMIPPLNGTAELEVLQHRLMQSQHAVELQSVAPLPRERLMAVSGQLAQVMAQAAPQPHPQPRRADYLDALSAAGYANLSADDMIALHDNGVSGSLIVASARYFNPRPSVKELIALSTSGVSGTYIEELSRYGLRAGPSDVRAYTLNGVSAPYAAIVLHAYPMLGTSSVIQLMQNGVPSRLVAGLRERGYAPTLSEIVELAQHGVSLEYVDAVNAHRGARMSLPEIVKLHDHGVSADAS
ncbi:MAG: M56 family metallopeptidase [Candidatus Eremiobacteraeota bacterium]|nr:M56 family metallopeptidase [Candidatus Eremiobacteraeota bacterium]